MKIATTMKNILLLITLLLAACSNPYYDFYRGKQYERQSSCEYLGSIASTAEIQNFLNSGYSIIGESAFSSTANHYSVDKMITTCKKVGADAAIIVEPEYEGTENVMRTYYTYQPGQTYTINSTNQVSGGFSGYYERGDREASLNGMYNGIGNSQTTVRTEGRYEAHPYMTKANKYIYRAFYLKRSN